MSPQLILKEQISPSVKEFVVGKSPVIGLSIGFVLVSLIFATVILPISKMEMSVFVQEKALVSIISAVLVVFVIVGSLTRSVIKESVMFISSVGVQVKQFNVLGLSTSTRFFPKSKIKALVINETIRRQRVVTYLALILNSPDECGRIIIPLFHKTLPRLSLVKKVYRESYNLLDI